MNASELIEFETEVARAFEEKRIRGPIHLAGGNEEQLIEIFKEIKPEDWVLSTWRSHYHALLKGVPRETVLADCLAGKSMFLHYPKYKFITSAIVAGMASIASGLAYGGERVWCFVGDMAASTGAFNDASKYCSGHHLDIRFVVEDNGFSTNTPTDEVWGNNHKSIIERYRYLRTNPHCGCGVYVAF